MTMRINPFLWALYHFLRLLAWLCGKVFFRRWAIIEKQRRRNVHGPLIIVSNHPSTLMDVLLVGATLPRVLYFLANYGLFKHPVSNWLLTRLYCIPVKRKEDVAEGEARDNEDAFEQSYIHLGKGGALFIAPEGVSYIDRFIRPLKTGTARIALGTEARYGNGVRILPIGLSYDKPHMFRTNCVLHIGAPIVVGDWLEQWRQNGPATVDALTGHIEEQLKALTIHCADEAGEKVVALAETILHDEAPIPLAKEYERTKQWLPSILQHSALRQALENYHGHMQPHNNDKIYSSPYPSWGNWFLLLTAPLALLAGVVWFVPLFLPYWANKKLQLYIGYSSTVKVVIGLFFTFPLSMVLLRYATKAWAPGFLGYLGALVLAVLLGLFLERYWDIYLWRKAHATKRQMRTEEWQAVQGQRERVVSLLTGD
jgi:glycerol-3-phosphate O-acyltransferase / dihydroxyacetone phosphate acyltransferase